MVSKDFSNGRKIGKAGSSETHQGKDFPLDIFPKFESGGKTKFELDIFSYSIFWTIIRQILKYRIFGKSGVFGHFFIEKGAICRKWQIARLGGYPIGTYSTDTFWTKMIFKYYFSINNANISMQKHISIKKNLMRRFFRYDDFVPTSSEKQVQQ